jgi:hypothetical protein
MTDRGTDPLNKYAARLACPTLTFYPLNDEPTLQHADAGGHRARQRNEVRSVRKSHSERINQMATLLSYLGSANIGNNAVYKAKAYFSPFGTKDLCRVHFLTAEDNKVIVQCDLLAGASSTFGVKGESADGKSFTVKLIKKTDLQIDISGVSESHLSHLMGAESYYWDVDEETAGRLVLKPVVGTDTEGYPTLTVRPDGDSTKTTCKKGNVLYALLKEVILSPM